VIGSSLAIPLTAIDEVDGDDEVDEDDGDDDDEVDEDGGDDDDKVDEDGPTGRARMCCQSKPAGEQ
jgi:hypothetical protein